MRELPGELADYLEGLMEGLVVYDGEWRMTYMNSAAERLLGKTREHVLGKTWHQAFPHAVGNRVDQMYQRVMRERVSERMEWFYEHYGRWLEIGASPVRTGGIAVYFRDTTERNAAEEMLRESERRFRVLADTAPAMLWTSEPDGSASFLSKGWYEFTGQEEVHALGLGWTQAVHPEDRDRATAAFLDANQQRVPFTVDYRVRRGDGEYRWVLDSGRPRFGPGGKFLGYVGSVIDVHERKQAEEALREADTRKDEFLATLAHELRNPLAPIRNAVQLMRVQGAEPRTLEAARDMIDRHVGHMVRLIDDLLDVSRITRGKLELRKERVRLASVLEQALETSQPHLGHELTVSLPEEPVYLEADPIRVAQVFSNLLTNACKYTEKGGRIWLSAQREGARAVVRVRDTGIGISAEHLPRLFQMFRQIDAGAGRSQGGLGIGLSLARSLVEMHGGSIEATSPGLGQGSEFTVRLPLATEAAPAAAQARPGGAPCALPPRRILVVDDVRDTALSLASLLRLEGNEVETAHDGVQAVRKAESFRPDVVLLDIGLPAMNGYDACRAIRAAPWGGAMTIVALTGWGQDEDRRKSRQAGFDVHLVKPVEHDAILEVIASAKHAARA